MSRDGPKGEPPAPVMDPSLADAAGGAGGPFPDTATGTRLVLYQTEDGAVDLRWHIDPADIAYARAAFGGAEAHAVLRLHRISGTGEDRLMADAELGSDAEAEGGLAHYARTDANGLLQAEIGLASEQGGWLLIARSNGLPAAAPVGAAFLHEPAAAPAPAAPAGDGPVAVNGDDALAPVTDEPAEALRLQPDFPLVEPRLSALAGAAVTPGTAVQGDIAAGGTSAAGAATAGAPSGDSPAEQPGALPGAQPGAQRQEPGAQQTLHHGADAPAMARAPRGRAAGTGTASYAARLLGEAGAAPLREPPPEPPPGGVVPRLTQRPHGPVDAAGPDPAPAAGSGPVHGAAGEATLSAELVVHGSAPPNTVLDLGGHAYRVGPGGRFLLRIPIREREVILRVLATLPWLPVAARPEAADDAGGD